jgi:hypothetical protein
MKSGDKKTGKSANPERVEYNSKLISIQIESLRDSEFASTLM